MSMKEFTCACCDEEGSFDSFIWIVMVGEEKFDQNKEIFTKYKGEGFGGSWGKADVTGRCKNMIEVL